MVQQTSIVVLLDVLDERHTFHEFSKMKLCSHNAFSQFYQLTFRAQKFENEERGSPSLSSKNLGPPETSAFASKRWMPIYGNATT